MNSVESQEIPKSNIEKSKERYEAASKALIEAGAMKFVELIEAKNPVAREYINALSEYEKALTDEMDNGDENAQI